MVNNGFTGDYVGLSVVYVTVVFVVVVVGVQHEEDAIAAFESRRCLLTQPLNQHQVGRLREVAALDLILLLLLLLRVSC